MVKAFAGTGILSFIAENSKIIVEIGSGDIGILSKTCKGR
jgi:hypothetical protein